MTSTWTEQAIALIKELWEDHSAAEIVKKLAENGHGSFTRNAVIGKLYRLGLTAKQKNKPHPQTAINLVPRVRVPIAHQVGAEASKIANAIKRKQRTALGVGAQVQSINRPPKIKPEPFVCQDVADIVPLRLSLFDLTDQTCKWPYGDQAPYEFCGHPPACGSPYCPGHTRVAIGQGTPAERAAHNVSRKVA